MAQESKPSRIGRRFIGMMKNAIEVEDGEDLGAICHLLFIQPPNGGLPTTYTVYLTPDAQGTFLVTCREFPEITALGEDEEDALCMAKLAIEEALGTQRSSPDFPY